MVHVYLSINPVDLIIFYETLKLIYFTQAGPIIVKSQFLK